MQVSNSWMVSVLRHANPQFITPWVPALHGQAIGEEAGDFITLSADGITAYSLP